MSRFLGQLGPAVALDNANAMLRIHRDTPPVVYNVYKSRGSSELRFQYLELPFSESQNPAYDRIRVGGRSEDYLSYAATDNRRISLSLGFSSSVDQNDNGSYDMAQRCTRWLQSLCYPLYVGGLQYPPPICQLVLGKAIRMRCVATQVEVQNHGPFGGFNSFFEYPTHTMVNVEFTSVNVSPLGLDSFVPTPGQELTRL